MHTPADSYMGNAAEDAHLPSPRGEHGARSEIGGSCEFRPPRPEAGLTPRPPCGIGEALEWGLLREVLRVSGDRGRTSGPDATSEAAWVACSTKRQGTKNTLGTFAGSAGWAS